MQRLKLLRPTVILEFCSGADALQENTAFNLGVKVTRDVA